MPEIPIFQNTEMAPLGAPFPYADASQFEAPSKALGQAGGALEQAGTDWGSIYAQAKRTQDSTTLTASGMQQLQNLQFTLSKTDDSAAAHAAYQTGAAGIIHDTMGQSSDPEVSSYVQRSLTSRSIIGAEETRDAAFGVESSKFRGQGDTIRAGYAQDAALATSEAGRQQFLQLGNDTIDSAVASHWMTPQEGADRKLQFTSQIAEVNAKRLIANDPIKAAALLADPGASAQAFPGLLPERASSLAGEASFKAMRVENRNNAAVAHQDAMAQQNQEAMLRRNETGVLADIADGKPMDRAAIDEAGRKGLFSPGGFMVIQGALTRQREGTDNTMTTLQLIAHLNDRTLTGADITAAALAGQDGDQGISGKTAVDLLKAVDEQSKTQDNALYTAGLAQVRQAFNAEAAERGVFGKDEQKQGQLAMVAQAEYVNRALVLHQNPQATAQDIITRYQQPPSSLQTVAGDYVSTEQDWLRVNAANDADYKAGKIDAATYAGQTTQLRQLKAMLEQRNGVPLPPKPSPVRLPGAAAPAATAALPPPNTSTPWPGSTSVPLQ
jgi:hypothetical protein